MLLLKDVVEEFKFDMQIKKYSIRTIKTATNNVLAFGNYLEKEFKIFYLEKVSHLHIKKYVSYLQQQGRAETYINNILKCLRMFYRYCIQEEYITTEKNPMKRVAWTREPKVIIETFTDEEVRKMFMQWNFRDFYNARNKAIIAVLFETGIRNFELCSIDLEDVMERVIKIKGKGNKERHVPISPALKKILIKYGRIREGYIKNKMLEEDAYFLSYRGKRLTVEAIQRVVKETGKMARITRKIRISPHTCRHYYAQFMLKQGQDIYTVSRLLGHEDITISRRYLQGLKDEEIINMSMDTSPLMRLKQ